MTKSLLMCVRASHLSRCWSALLRKGCQHHTWHERLHEKGLWLLAGGSTPDSNEDMMLVGRLGDSLFAMPAPLGHGSTGIAEPKIVDYPMDIDGRLGDDVCPLSTSVSHIQCLPGAYSICTKHPLCMLVSHHGPVMASSLSVSRY